MTHRLVSIVDDDESVREALPDLLESFGLEVHPFASAEEFLASDSIDRTGCLILDVSMPGMSGPALQRHLAGQHRNIPIIFITAYSDEAKGIGLGQTVAVACLIKPFSEEALLDAVRAALGDA